MRLSVHVPPIDITIDGLDFVIHGEAQLNMEVRDDYYMTSYDPNEGKRKLKQWLEDHQKGPTCPAGPEGRP